MKVGDLVKWDHPYKPFQDLGIITEIKNANSVHVCWVNDNNFSADYDPHHRYFKLLTSEQNENH